MQPFRASSSTRERRSALAPYQHLQTLPERLQHQLEVLVVVYELEVQQQREVLVVVWQRKHQVQVQVALILQVVQSLLWFEHQS
jgi:hypothetical protein